MSDRPVENAKSAEPVAAQANSLARIWYEQKTVGEPDRTISPIVTPQGTGSIIGRVGKYCVIETDSHVVTPVAQALVGLNEKTMAKFGLDPANGPYAIQLHLDTKTPVLPFVQLSNNKVVSARIVENRHDLDRAKLKFRIQDADTVCNPASKGPAKPLVIGEKYTSLGFGQAKTASAHELVFEGLEAVGEVKNSLAKQGIDTDDGMKKWDDKMQVLIFDGEANSGDSGGPVLDKDGVRVGRALASGVATIDGKQKYITYAAPVESGESH